jgi:hypothetical protein
MTDAAPAQQLLIDAFDRIRDLVVNLTDGLTREIGGYRPDDRSNSISWLIWHLTRIQDDHLAHLARTDQVWDRWREDFKLPFDPRATGYGQSADEVGQVRVDGELLGGYHLDVHELTRSYLDGITVEELARVIDTRWDPPVTAAVRLVSVVGDALQHLGQAAYVRGLAERKASAWHQSGAADR